MIKEVDFQKTVESAFLTYAASVAQERAIPDVRDMLKIGLRQGLYAQYTHKHTHKDKFQKAAKSVSAAIGQSYTHGDVAMYDTFIRAARPWSYRYPLEETQGSAGDQTSPDSQSAMRYVEMRSSEIADILFKGLKKNAIGEEWYLNYDDTEQIPSVFPSIGFWNIVNGCSGIAVAMATSVPTFNLKEVNNALIKLIKNKEIPFDEIYCAPDFPTGGTITNGAEVKESLRTGKGKSIRIRANLKYNPTENMIQATELPYGVFTDTILEQLAAITQKDEDYGVLRVVDHTKKFADIRIYLEKGVNPSRMIERLYHDTSLENWFSINMILLDKGRFPKIFGWKDACNAYIEHIRECKCREIQFDLDKALARENIINGLLIAVANIDDIVAIIRASDSPTEAEKALITKYSFNKPQAEAILSIKLSALTKIDGIKLNTELGEIRVSISNYQYLLSEPTALDEQLIKILEEIANKFGDSRKTKIVNILNEEAEPEIIEEVDEFVFFENNRLKRVTASEYKGRKTTQIYTTNLHSLIAITDTGKMYKIPVSKIKMGKEVAISDFIKDKVIYIEDDLRFYNYKTITCITKNGFIKKSLTSDYKVNALKGVPAIKLDSDDSIISVLMSTNEDDRVVIINESNFYNCFSIGSLSCIGRLTKGVKGIKLNNEYVKKSFLIDKENADFKTTNRGVKGEKYNG